MLWLNWLLVFFLTVIGRCPLTISIRKLRKWSLIILTVSGSYTAHQEPHREASGRERKNASPGPWDFLSVGVEHRVSWAQSLLVNLKWKSRYLKLREMKNKWPKWSVIKINQDLKTKKPQAEGVVAWLFKCLCGRQCVYSR